MSNFRRSINFTPKCAHCLLYHENDPDCDGKHRYPEIPKPVLALVDYSNASCSAMRHRKEAGEDTTKWPIIHDWPLDLPGLLCTCNENGGYIVETKKGQPPLIIKPWSSKDRRRRRKAIAEIEDKIHLNVFQEARQKRKADELAEEDEREAKKLKEEVLKEEESEESRKIEARRVAEEEAQIARDEAIRKAERIYETKLLEIERKATAENGREHNARRFERREIFYRQYKVLKSVEKNVWVYEPHDTDDQSDLLVPVDSRILLLSRKKCLLCNLLLNKESATRLPCDKIFHTRCLRTWFEQPKQKAEPNLKCPDRSCEKGFLVLRPESWDDPVVVGKEEAEDWENDGLDQHVFGFVSLNDLWAMANKGPHRPSRGRELGRGTGGYHVRDGVGYRRYEE